MFSPLQEGYKDEQGSVILSRSALSNLTFTTLYTLTPCLAIKETRIELWSRTQDHSCGTLSKLSLLVSVSSK